MRVRDIMQSEVVTVGPDMNVRDLVQLLARHRISGVPVIDEAGAIAGVVSATDVVALAAYGKEPARGAGVWDAEPARFLLRGRIHRALVIDDGTLVGIVSAFDVLNAVAAVEEFEPEVVTA